ncbi:MAG: DUF1428 domain-containing protein [Kofleriaceae bacterium]|jgi:uncharacterized protein YbaA (DUF1428 family)|nr:DUF1428 domain-containing protein [Kofleriaceae bacterium]
MYVDGFVIPVKKKRLAEYRRFARKYDALWIKYGALAVHECAAEDVKPGKVTSFPQAVKAKPDELVVLSWIVYKSRRHRDAVNKKVMADPMMAGVAPSAMPFDGKRMFWGGFSEIVALGRKT